MARFVVVLLALTVLNGCYFLRPVRTPVRALSWQPDPAARQSCLLVLMPGMFDTPSSFYDHGFVRDAIRASDRCDLVAVDAHFRYYAEENVRTRVREDILRVAQGRGYQEIWMVGISMGGLGAMLVARDNPDIVDGVVLMSPFLGDTNVHDRIREAGGLRAWTPDSVDDPYGPAGYTEALWDWMRNYASNAESRPSLYVGYSDEESQSSAARMLRQVLPRGRFLVREGGHNWETWRTMWRTWMRTPPWGNRAGSGFEEEEGDDGFGDEFAFRRADRGML